MKWITSVKSDCYEFEIIKDEGLDVVSGETICFYTFYAHDSLNKDDRDYQQDDLDMVQRCANSHFSIPLDSWIQVE